MGHLRWWRLLSSFIEIVCLVSEKISVYLLTESMIEWQTQCDANSSPELCSRWAEKTNNIKHMGGNIRNVQQILKSNFVVFFKMDVNGTKTGVNWSASTWYISFKGFLPVPTNNSKQGRDGGGKNANGVFYHRASNLGAKNRIYCHIWCNLNALMAVRWSIWNCLVDICRFLMPGVHNDKLN